MAILERKKVANQLVVDEAVNVDNSVVSLNPKTMKKMQLFCANTIQLKAGYYCSVCECVVKDSAIYLDHNNEKKHQRALGMSMRVERASLQQVMTPKPECGTIDTPILDALHTMHNGKFLHLPVLDRDGTIVSVIDVIHVTHAAVAIVQERFESLKKRKVLETFTE